MFTNSSLGQGDEHRIDTLLSKCIGRYVRHPHYENGGSVGVNFLLITKQDSIEIKSVYHSNERFEIKNLADLQRKVNDRCRNQIESTNRLIVPVYFYFGEELQLPSKMADETKRRLEKLIKQGYTVSTFPVTIVEFENVR